MIFQYFFEILEYLFEYRSCSLTRTYNQEVFFIGFPCYGMLECWNVGMLDGKNRRKYLPDRFTFIQIEIFLCTFESEKYTSCDFSENTI